MWCCRATREKTSRGVAGRDSEGGGGSGVGVDWAAVDTSTGLGGGGGGAAIFKELSNWRALILWDEGLRSFAESKAAGASCAVAGALELLLRVVGALVMDSRTELSNVRDLMR